MAADPQALNGDKRGLTRMGVDIGGTFTDVAVVDEHGQLHVGKRLTTHGAESDGVLGAVEDTLIDVSNPEMIIAHGTTLVINSLIERQGARVGLVTTEGFADVIELGRGNRPEGFNLVFRREPPLVPPERRFEVSERVYPSGEIARRPTTEELDLLVERLRAAEVEAVAVAFINSYVEPGNERHVGDHLAVAMPDVTVTLSSDTSRQWREYERFTTAVANAYVAPVVGRYLTELVSGLERKDFSGQFVVLDSSGGAMAVSTASRFPIRAVESGPVAGVIGGRRLADQLKIRNMVTFDMGGTTAKSAFVEDGRYATTDLYWIAGYKRGFPIQVNTVDVIEVGAGGGSLAWIDDAGRLRVGPRSAGSVPGPACYGLGGTEPTVTDANLYCGRLDKDHFVGELQLDEAAAAAAIEGLAARAGLSPSRLALGILQLANIRMAGAVRRQTLERGRDPRDFTLLATGGAGPMHACEVAAEVGIGQVLIPVFPGHFSAIGMLNANLRLDRREVMRSRLSALDVEAMSAAFARIGSELLAELVPGQGNGVKTELRYSLALRYEGQEHALMIPSSMTELSVPAEEIDKFRLSFEEEYVLRYGHLDEQSEIEVVELEVVAERILPGVEMGEVRPSAGAVGSIESYFASGEDPVTSQVIPRARLSEGDVVEGPAVLFEDGATTVIPPRAVARVVERGNIIVDVTRVTLTS